MHAHFCKAFSAYPVSPMSVVDFTKNLVHPRAEVLGIWAVLKLVGKSSAATFNIADQDLDKLVSSFVATGQATINGQPNIWGPAAPDVFRDIQTYAHAADLYQLDILARNASAVPAVGGTAETLFIPISVPGELQQAEFPNLNAMSSGQLWNNSRFDLNLVASPPALPATVVLTNGSFVVSAVSAELHVLRGSIRDLLWMAPAPRLFVRNAVTITVESETGPLFDPVVFATVPPISNSGGIIKVTIDGKDYLDNTKSTDLQRAASLHTKMGIFAGVPGYDIWQNTKDSQASRTGRIPLVYMPGQHPTEKEYPVVKTGRAINFSPSNTAAPQLAFWRYSLITSDENQKHFASMLNDPAIMQWAKEGGLNAEEVAMLKSLSQAEFSTYGGETNSLWKPMEFARRPGA